MHEEEFSKNDVRGAFYVSNPFGKPIPNEATMPAIASIRSTRPAKTEKPEHEA